MAPSKSTKSPAFQFYASDFLGSEKVAQMSYSEIGMYAVLLARAWIAKGLPNDVTAIASILKLNPQRFKKIWAGVLSQCWIERGGRLVNPRQELERQKQNDYRAKQAANARHGRRTANAPPEASQNEPPLSQASACALKSEDRKPKTEDLVSSEGGPGGTVDSAAGAFAADVAIRELQDAYPQNRVTYGYRTESAFVDNCTSEQDFAVMLANLENHKRSHEWRVKGMVPALEKWLREGLWRREMSEDAAAGERLTAKTNRTAEAMGKILRRQG